ncbi:TerB family tellurite resistance protein [Phreatobacter stygius]|nr:TerB family tellurite resistance protein [Phreatobacter stygius]
MATRPITRPPRPGAADAPDASLPPIAAGRSFLIEYEDAAGRLQLRPVTVWSVKVGADGVPILVVHSHDRRALRSFRLDRIKAVADFDGVVQEPLADFFMQVLGLDWPGPSHGRSDAKLAADRWAVVRKVAREGGLVLLAAMAAADSHVSAEEVQVILDHALRTCAAQGIRLTIAESERLRTSIGRMRPSPEAVDRAVVALADADAATIAAVIDACLAIADADGFRHHREMTLLNRLSFGLTGRRLPGAA